MVLAAVAATATGHEIAAATGLRAESGAELAVLLLEAGDGTRALPVFTEVSQLQRWRLDARPVQLSGPEACQAALEQGATHVVVDAAGAAVTLTEAEVRAVATGWVPVAGTQLRSRTGPTALHAPSEPVSAALLTALREAVAPEGVSARLLEGPEGLVLGISTRPVLDPAGLAALAQRVLARLGPELPAAGLGVAQVAARGSGVVVARGRWFRRR